MSVKGRTAAGDKRVVSRRNKNTRATDAQFRGRAVRTKAAGADRHRLPLSAPDLPRREYAIHNETQARYSMLQMVRDFREHHLSVADMTVAKRRLLKRWPKLRSTFSQLIEQAIRHIQAESHLAEIAAGIERPFTASRFISINGLVIRRNAILRTDEPPIRIARSPGDKSPQYASEIAILDGAGNTVARLIYTPHKRQLACGARLVLECVAVRVTR